MKKAKNKQKEIYDGFYYWFAKNGFDMAFYPCQKKQEKALDEMVKREMLNK